MKKENKEVKRKNKGITLIALIITIIVVLILAGVAIATIAGENGILTKAMAAKEKTSEAEAKESIQLEAIGSIDYTTGKFSYEDFKTNVKKNLGLTDTDIVDNGNTVTVTYKGYDVEIDKITGELVLPLEPTEVGKIVTGKNKVYTNTTEDGKTLTAVIPVGYGIVPDLDDISEGLVITDYFDAEGNSDGNEFVWIPVETAISDTEANGTTNKAMAINLGTAENPQYRGLLYNFTDTGSTVQSGCTTTNDGNREPAYLTNSSYGDASSYNTVGITEASLQSEYNDMVKSVIVNGGFYVSRYEMSLDGSKNPQSKKLQPSATNASSSANMWYGLYNKAKNYALNGDSTKKVVSSMIWGSQYDAMMNWMHKDSNIDVSSSTPITGASRNTTRTTGGANSGQTESKDILKNVYDLLGNSYEWTLEAVNSYGRVDRGGYYDYSYSPANRSYYSPIGSDFVDYSTRLALYIK